MASSSASFVPGSSDSTTGAGALRPSLPTAAARVLPARRRNPHPAPIVIRRSGIVDLPALRRLASIEGRALPAGAFLVAESGGKLIAAAPLENDAASLRDPDGHADDIRPLLEQQAAVIRARRRFVRAA